MKTIYSGYPYEKGEKVWCQAWDHKAKKMHTYVGSIKSIRRTPLDTKKEFESIVDVGNKRLVAIYHDCMGVGHGIKPFII